MQSPKFVEQMIFADLFSEPFFSSSARSLQHCQLSCFDFSKMADKILQRIRHLTRFKGYFKGPKDQQIASVSSQGSSKNGPSGPNITPLEPSWKDPPGPYISAEDKYLANPTMKPRTQEDLCKYVEDAKWKVIRQHYNGPENFKKSRQKNLWNQLNQKKFFMKLHF